jgi:hypothetical protein
MDDLRTKFTYHQQTLDTQVNKGNSRLTHSVQKHIKHITDHANHIVDHLNTTIKNTMDHHTDSFRSRLQNITQTNINTLETKMQNYEKTLDTRIENALERTIQELTETTDATIQHITQAHMPSASSIGNTSTTKIRSTLFPNADPSLYESAPVRHNPYATADPTQGNQYIHQSPQEPQPESSDDEWGRFGPTESESQIYEACPLPTLYSYKLVNQVKVPYSGRESSYTGYYTFRSAVLQYGILLIPVEEFEKDKSLCPKKYYGTKVEALRYRDMATALYQLLNLSDTIPHEHTEVRNIIQRHAFNTDGYSALYEIMAQIHPLLNPDAKLQPPQSINCTDIHEYYNQLDSYFLHSRLKHSLMFTPRQQVNQFLDGLDSSYTPAIRQIRQHMMMWRNEQHEPPEDLLITSLVSTVECIMQEEAGMPIIQTMTHHQNPQKPHRPRPPRTDSNNHCQYIDIQCTLCKTYGHKNINCDKMSQWLTLQENSQQVDEKLKARLMANYTKLNNERRTKRLQRLKGTVRQLYTEGQAEQADALWDQYISINNHDTADEDDSSTSSDE